MKRYRMKVGVHDSDTGWNLVYDVDAKEHPEGEWVKWEDVQQALISVANYINHIALVLDASGSMRSITKDVTTANLPNASQLGQVLVGLHPGQYRFIAVQDAEPIAEFVERKLRRAYRTGEAYYQLTKPEEIQPQKKIAFYDRTKHKLFVGDEARALLKLPDYTVKVSVDPVQKFDVYVQSTSVNRKLVPGTNLLIL